MRKKISAKIDYKDLKKTLIILFSLMACIEISFAQEVDYFIGEALKNNPSLNDYRNFIKQGSIDSMKVDGSFMPQVNSNAQAMYAPTSGNFGYDAAITNGGNYVAVVGASQDILKGGERKNRLEAIGLSSKGFSNTGRITKNELIRQVTLSYITALSDFNELKFNRDFLSLMQDQGNLIKELARQGIYRQSDYLALMVEIQGQQVNINKLELRYRDDIHALKQLCGISDTSSIKISSPELIRKMPVNPSTSPLFMQFSIDSLSLINSRNALDTRYRPRLSWFADAGVMSSTPSDLYRHLGFSLGLNFSIPIYDGSQRKYERQSIGLQEINRAFHESYFRSKYSDQLKQLDEQLGLNTKMSESIEEQSRTADELIRLYKAQLNQGNITVTELINAIRNYRNIQQNLNQVRIDRLRIIADWNYLMQD